MINRVKMMLGRRQSIDAMDSYFFNVQKRTGLLRTDLRRGPQGLQGDGPQAHLQLADYRSSPGTWGRLLPLESAELSTGNPSSGPTSFRTPHSAPKISLRRLLIPHWYSARRLPLPAP